MHHSYGHWAPLKKAEDMRRMSGAPTVYCMSEELLQMVNVMVSGGYCREMKLIGDPGVCRKHNRSGDSVFYKRHVPVPCPGLCRLHITCVLVIFFL